MQTGQRAVYFTYLFLAAAFAFFPRFASAYDPKELKKVAEHHAPLIYQAADTSADYITNFDFDGDNIGNNNWENQEKFPNKAYVYYAVSETKTHVFLFYGLFHPRDYEKNNACMFFNCHENDMESIQIVVEKNKTEFGKVVLMETLAHGSIYLYTNEPGITGGFLKKKGGITYEKEKPVVYVEVFGHGVYGNPADSSAADPSKQKHIVYRFKGKPEVPESPEDKDAGYDLLSIYDTLWTHRESVGKGKAFDCPFTYRGVTLPACLDGEDFGKDKANTPWGYDQATGKDVVRGDWFFDPAKAILFHTGNINNFSLDYIYNPFLKNLQF